MLHASMAAKKNAATKPATKGATKGATKTPEKLSFAEIGRRAAKDAQRKALLDALAANGWNLTATAKDLEMGAGAHVIRALKELAPDEHEAAKARGDVRAGRPTEE